ncbi:MAG: 30S ribosomal protein S16 [bacterium]|nr:30S ribosomal protein S16 [bacterium]
MLTIRLTRVGKTKQPVYRVIVSEKARDPWGKALELLGTYNPRTNPSTVNFNVDRIKYWMSKGAQTSDTMWNLLLDQKVVEGERRKHLQISKRRKEKIAKKAAK